MTIVLTKLPWLKWKEKWIMTIKSNWNMESYCRARLETYTLTNSNKQIKVPTISYKRLKDRTNCILTRWDQIKLRNIYLHRCNRTGTRTRWSLPPSNTCTKWGALIVPFNILFNSLLVSRDIETNRGREERPSSEKICKTKYKQEKLIDTTDMKPYKLLSPVCSTF